jgi:hypothetical protein
MTLTYTPVGPRHRSGLKIALMAAREITAADTIKLWQLAERNQKKACQARCCSVLPQRTNPTP